MGNVFEITKKPNESMGERGPSACFQRLWDASEIDQIKQIARKEAKANPQLANSIMESARMSLGEIAAGESAANELELFEGHIEELKGCLLYTSDAADE